MNFRLYSANDKKEKDESLSLNMGDGNVIIDMTEYKYNTVHEFDSVQATLPDSAKEKGIMHWILRHNIGQKQKRGMSTLHVEVDITHEIPKLMFILLPLFACYVGWFYPRKKYYYVNHAIFSVHYHSFLFLFFLVFTLLERILPGDWTPIILGLISLFGAFVYLVAALHGMYGQTFWLALFKGLAITLIYIVTLSLASTLLMIGAYIWL